LAVSPKIRKAVQDYISDKPEVDIMTPGRSGEEPEAGITVVLICAKKISPEFEAGLIKAVHKARGNEPVVRIFPVVSAR
jgi:hypothetical protein